MRTVTEAVAAAEAVKERVGAGLRQFEEGIGQRVEQGVEQGRRVILKGRRAAEDGAAATALEIRRHPFRATAFAAFAGAFIGCVAGFAVGRCARR